MARPRSEERRDRILAAATQVVAAQGLGAATATIATRAGVSNGSLFGYFDTKAMLLNELYVALKTEMATAALEGLPAGSPPREQVLHLWNQWLGWATAFPEKRRALAQLDVSDDVTAQSRATVSAGFTGIAELLERSRAGGPMRDAPLGFVLALMTAVAETTIDAIAREPEPAAVAARRRFGFEAIWRILA